MIVFVAGVAMIVLGVATLFLGISEYNCASLPAILFCFLGFGMCIMDYQPAYIEFLISLPWVG